MHVLNQNHQLLNGLHYRLINFVVLNHGEGCDDYDHVEYQIIIEINMTMEV